MNRNTYNQIPSYKNFRLYKLLRYFLKYRISNFQLYLAKRWFRTNRFKFYEDDLVINLIVNQKKSIVRFGDGEYSCMVGAMRSSGWAGYSQCDKFVKEELAKIIRSYNHKLIIGILLNPPGTLESGTYLQNLNYIEYIYYKYYRKLRNYIPLESTYASSGIFLPHHNYVKTTSTKRFYDKFDVIWNNKKVIFLYGLNGRFDPNHYAFRNVKEKLVINCDSINAHRNLDSILSEIISYSNDYLVIISAGFLAKLLVPRLVNRGFQALDVGDFTYKLD